MVERTFFMRFKNQLVWNQHKFREAIGVGKLLSAFAGVFNKELIKTECYALVLNNFLTKASDPNCLIPKPIKLRRPQKGNKKSRIECGSHPYHQLRHLLNIYQVSLPKYEIFLLIMFCEHQHGHIVALKVLKLSLGYPLLSRFLEQLLFRDQGALA